MPYHTHVHTGTHPSWYPIEPLNAVLCCRRATWLCYYAWLGNRVEDRGELMGIWYSAISFDFHSIWLGSKERGRNAATREIKHISFHTCILFHPRSIPSTWTLSWRMINNDYWLDVDLISTAEEELTLTIFSWWYRRTDVLAFLHPFMSHWTAKVGHASRPSGTEGDSSQQQNYANFQIDFDAIRNRWDWWSAGGGDTK